MHKFPRSARPLRAAAAGSRCARPMANGSPWRADRSGLGLGLGLGRRCTALGRALGRLAVASLRRAQTGAGQRAARRALGTSETLARATIHFCHASRGAIARSQVMNEKWSAFVCDPNPDCGRDSQTGASCARVCDRLDEAARSLLFGRGASRVPRPGAGAQKTKPPKR